MAPRTLTPKLIQIQPASEVWVPASHPLVCPHCIKERIRKRQVVDKIMASNATWFKGVIVLIIEIVKSTMMLLALTIPLLVLLAASACCKARKKSPLEEDLDSMAVVSPRVLAERMPEPPTDMPAARRTRLRRRTQLAS